MDEDNTTSGGRKGDGAEVVYTTNAADIAAVAQLNDRIAASNSQTQSNNASTTSGGISSNWKPVPSVSIDEGAHKYVLISAAEPSSSASSNNNNETKYFVISKRGASYHRNAAEPLVDTLQSRGYQNIHVTGGGRILMDEDEKRISIFGYSYGFGQANHAISKEVIDADERFAQYNVSWSNDGY